MRFRRGNFLHNIGDSIPKVKRRKKDEQYNLEDLEAEGMAKRWRLSQSGKSSENKAKIAGKTLGRETAMDDTVKGLKGCNRTTMREAINR